MADKIYHKQLYESELDNEFKSRDLQSIAKWIIQGSESILDIGCGIGDYLKYTSPEQKVTGVEPHAPYLKAAKEKYPWVNYINSDGISFLKDTNNNYDCILMIDVVEHLEEKDSIELVELAKQHCDRIIFSQIPVGLHEQHDDAWQLGGEYWQTHRSIWNKDNFHKLGFSNFYIWENWYEWEETVNKSNATSIAFWIKNYTSEGDNILFDLFIKGIEKENYSKWNEAHAEGYNSNMGDHSNYFYNKYLESIGLFRLIAESKTIVEFGPGDGSFWKKYISKYPDKAFHFFEIADSKLQSTMKEFENYNNVTCHLNYPSGNKLKGVDLAFSFLLAQSMPRILFKKHLVDVNNMLSVNGSYIFQIAYHTDSSSDNVLNNAISGSNKYKPEEVFEMLEAAGFSGCDVTEPITLETFQSDIIWYFCRAYKKVE